MNHTARRRSHRLLIPGIALAVVAAGTTVVAGLAPHRAAAASALPAPYKGELVAGRHVAPVSATLAQPKLAVAASAQLPAPARALLSWPAARAARSTTAVAAQKIAGSNLTVTPRARVGATPITQLQSEILDRSTVSGPGLSGLVLRLSRVDGVSSSAPVGITIPAATLAGLYGADYLTRVRWVSLPATATPQQLRSGTVRPTVLPQTRTAAGTMVVTPEVSDRPMLLAATAAPSSSGGAGTFAATSLRPAGSWSVSAQTGDFSWSYPFTGTAPAAGPAPNLAATYDSGSVDGETASTNNQSSVLGDGWELSGSGFIERTYTPCSLDGTGLTGDQATSGDQCWSGDNDTISFGGHSGSLVPDGTANEFRIQNDDGSRVRYLPAATGCTDGGNSGSGCWQLTSQDGTSYYFGQDANSAWTEPVFGDDSGEPCHAATFAASACAQVWRWNLDRVVDVHGNSETFSYKTNDNYYHQDNGGLVKYVRNGYLTEIDYGIAPGSATASNRIVLGYDQFGRCNVASPSAANCADQSGNTLNTPTTASNYPDVPWDQNCPTASSTCTGLTAPTFWTTEQLGTVTAQSMISGAWASATVWTLKHQFVDPGDTSAASMWLSDITHPNVSGAPTLDTHFVPLSLNNRVKNDVYLPLAKQRIGTINLETGGAVLIDYDVSDCTATNIASINPAANSHRCFPQFWTPTGNTQPILDWFNKYRVKAVTEDPMTGGPNDQATYTQYLYTSSPAWRLDTNASTQTSDRTWSDYAGYRSVEVRAGDSNLPAQQHTTDYVFFQGLDHDADGTNHYRSVSITADGHTVTDAPSLAGRTFETIIRNGAAGGTDPTQNVLSDTVTVPWVHPTALRGASIQYNDPTSSATPPPTYTASLDTGAYQIDDGTTYAASTLASGATRTVTTTTGHDGYGRVTQASVDTPDAGSVCTTTEYATDTTGHTDTNLWLLDLPSRVISAGASCGTTPNYPLAAISDTRYFYDGATNLASQTLTVGNLTRTDQVKDYSGGSGIALTIAQTPTSGYDAMGRLLTVTNAVGTTTSTSYTPATGGPLLSSTVTDAPGTSLALSTTTAYSPLWEQPSSVTDPNGNVTTGVFDALGRRTQVWLPDRSQASNPTSPSMTYSYVLDSTKAQSVGTTTLNSSGGAITSYTFADGLSRPVQTQTAMDSADSQGNHFIGGTVLTDTYYDPAGQVRLVNNSYGTSEVTPSATLFAPTATTTIPSQTQTLWDGAGRQTATITEGLNTATHSYGELFRTSYSYPGTDRTDVTPPTGGTPTTTITNSLGHMTDLYQYLNATPTGTSEHTTYGYNARGDLTAMTDPSTNKWSWVYDPRGNQIQAVDPDTGTTNTTYDADNNVATTTDTESQQIKFTYDALDRKVGEYELQSSPTAGWAQIAGWSYDSATLGKGMAAGSTSYVGSTASGVGTAYSEAIGAYNVNGQPLSTSTTIPGWAGATGNTVFSKSYSYNLSGQLATYTEPAVTPTGNERVSLLYDSMGNLYQMGGSTGYLNNLLYTSTNQPSTMVFKNGSTELDRLYTYNDATKRLTNLGENATGASLTHVASHTYTYNNAGLLTEDSNLADGTATDNQCYQYDQLEQLAQAWSPAAATGCAAPTYTNLGGPAPYWQEYTYDPATGNRLSVTRHATTTGGTNTRVTSSYQTTAPTQPHVLAGTQNATSSTSAPTTFGNTTSATYGSTADGQALTRPGQTLVWNKEGKLASTGTAAGTVSNIYDADGNLLLQTDPTTGKTLYLDDTELHTAAGSNTVYKVRTYSVGGVPIMERSTTAAAPSTVTAQWLDASPFGQNTAGDETSASTGAVTHRYLDPYGNARATPPAWSSTHTFLNAPSDANTATVHLSARDYDPVLGRFLSADSVLDPSNTLQNNGYTYGWNDPVQNADPSGQRPAGDKNDTDAGDHGGITTCPSCSNPTKPFTAANGWTDKTVSIDTKTVQVTVTTPNPGCERFKNASLCGETKTMSLYDLMHPPPGPNNYCGGWSWACTLVGYNQARNCIAHPSFGECAQAVLALISDVTLVGGMAKLADIVAEAAITLGADSAESVVTIATDEAISTAPDAAAADVTGEDVGGEACAAQSFTPDTRVVMADGSTKRLDQVQVGDKVKATDPDTGRTTNQAITATWINHDNDLLALRVLAGDRISTIQTTQHHPFWDVTRDRWVPAGQLPAGDLLRSDGNWIVSVVGESANPGAANMWDLTVAVSHDFFVATGSGVNVLVHNCKAPLGRGSTGRGVPENLREQLALAQAQSDPGGGKVITSITMNDSRWPAAEGWMKMQQKINGVIIHYVWNPALKAVDDFKFK